MPSVQHQHTNEVVSIEILESTPHTAENSTVQYTIDVKINMNINILDDRSTRRQGPVFDCGCSTLP